MSAKNVRKRLARKRRKKDAQKQRHFNKYGLEAFEGRSCLNKATFETKEEAEQNKAQYAYKCRFCGKWHRSTKRKRG